MSTPYALGRGLRSAVPALALGAAGLTVACADSPTSPMAGAAAAITSADVPAALPPGFSEAPARALVLLKDDAVPVVDVARDLLRLRAPQAVARGVSFARMADSISHVEPLTGSRGFVAALTGRELLALRADPRVAAAEPAMPMRAFDAPASAPDALAAPNALASVNALTSTTAATTATSTATSTAGGVRTWALDRMTHHNLPLTGVVALPGTGRGVTIYVLDTGIRESHSEFGGRVLDGPDFVAGGFGHGDCNGHGTGVASDAAGATIGAASAATIVNVRVLDCQGLGNTVDIARAIDWVTTQAQAHPGPAVMNLSFGSRGESFGVNEAVTRATRAGVTAVIAAGNGGVDACGVAPASTPSAITVGASDPTDYRAGFSNYGKCVALYAPGMNVAGATAASDIAVDPWCGTSAASPFVAGLAALYLEAHPTATPAQVQAALIANATAGVLKGPNAEPNRLAYVAPGTAPAAPTPVTPKPVMPATAVATVTCQTRNCAFDGRTSTLPGGVQKYTWDLGDGTTSTGATLTHRYAKDGTFAVRLTVGGAAGATASGVQTVKVSDAVPVAAAAVTCNGWACSFDAGAAHDDGTIVRYDWTFGDGTTSSTANAVLAHTYAKAGSYAATLTVTDDIGQRSTPVTLIAKTTPRPPVAAATLACSGRTCSFDASASKDDGAIVSYTWAFADGTNLNSAAWSVATGVTGAKVTHTFTTGGSKLYQVTVRDAAGLSTTAQYLFSVK